MVGYLVWLPVFVRVRGSPGARAGARLPVPSIGPSTIAPLAGTVGVPETFGGGGLSTVEAPQPFADPARGHLVPRRGGLLVEVELWEVQ